MCPPSQISAKASARPTRLRTDVLLVAVLAAISTTFCLSDQQSAYRAGWNLEHLGPRSGLGNDLLVVGLGFVMCLTVSIRLYRGSKLTGVVLTRLLLMAVALVLIPMTYLHFWDVPRLLERRGTEGRLAQTLDLDGLRRWAESQPRFEEDSESNLPKTWTSRTGVTRPEGYSSLAHVVPIQNANVPEGVVDLLGTNVVVTRVIDPVLGSFISIRRDRIALWIGVSEMPFESYWPFQLKIGPGIYFYREVHD